VTPSSAQPGSGSYHAQPRSRPGPETVRPCPEESSLDPAGCRQSPSSPPVDSTATHRLQLNGQADHIRPGSTQSSPSTTPLEPQPSVRQKSCSRQCSGSTRP